MQRLLMPSHPIHFHSGTGDRLSARLDLPERDPVAYALFAHCFTCSKDTRATAFIAQALAQAGIAVLRFDFTGLGGSEGEFADSNFASNVDDLVTAADFLRTEFAAPKLIIGHSLGGAAAIMAAVDIPECVAVATINAPAEPSHVLQRIEPARDRIQREGEAEVELAGRRFRIRQHFLDALNDAHPSTVLPNLARALIIFHAPLDREVGIDNAARLFAAARHPKSFVSLDDADHMLSRRADALYVGAVLAAWATRYLAEPESPSQTADHGCQSAP